MGDQHGLNCAIKRVKMLKARLFSQCASELAESDPRRSLGLEDEGARGADVLGVRHAEMEAQQDLDGEGGREDKGRQEGGGGDGGGVKTEWKRRRRGNVKEDHSHDILSCCGGK